MAFLRFMVEAEIAADLSLAQVSIMMKLKEGA
jgi:hypothetical protein